jgi:O-6-methylguanine DNA methyltransferase
MNDSSRVLRVYIKVRATPQGLRQIELGPWPEQEFPCSGEAVYNTVYRIHISLHGEPPLHEMLQEDLKTYFSGQPVNFINYPVDWQDMSPFSRKVLDPARSIPWGETQNYGWLSAQLKLKGGARAVGGALGRNPVPIVIPCHRVLKKDGQMGGFSAGIQWKRFLLDLEGKAPVKTLVEFLLLPR